jgi:hypothetical protein
MASLGAQTGRRFPVPRSISTGFRKAQAGPLRIGTQNVARSANLHGQLGVGVDWRKFFGVTAPPLPANVPGAAGIFLKFYGGG